MTTTTRELPTLQAETRDKVGSRESRRLRDRGQLPVVVYGHGEPPQHVGVNAKLLSETLARGHQTLMLELQGKTQMCLVKQVQYDHLGMHPIHLDLTRVRMGERVQTSLPLEFINEAEAPGLRETGATMQHPTAELQIEGPAGSLPESLSVDLSEMEAGATRTADQITLPEGITLVSPGDTVVATITLVAEEPVEPEVAEAGAEPEVIGEGEEGGQGEGQSEESA